MELTDVGRAAPAIPAFETLDALLETCAVDAVLITAPPALQNNSSSPL